jgi:tetratricopeptide (TPR) repeat protein
VHELTNCHTGLTLHQIRIPRDGRNAAEVAARRSAKLAELRELGIGDEPEPLVVQAHGGWFEIDEVWTFPDDRATALYEQAVRAAQQENWAECRALGERVLAEHPDHTLALDVVACSYGETGEFVPALQLGLAAIEHEPNLRSVRHNLLRYAAAGGHIGLFTEQFADVKRKWPAYDELDELAAEIHLDRGRPDLAAGLRIPDAELLEQVRQELRHRERARAFMDTARSEMFQRNDEKAAKALKQAYAEYAKDVEIAFNWGHLLLRRGDWREAHVVLGGIITSVSGAVRTQCLGSIAFALAIGGEYRAAADHLMMVSQWLTGISGGAPPVVFDLPFWAAWMENDRVLADRSLRQPFLLVDRIISGVRKLGVDDPELLPALSHMRDLYERGFD